MQGWPVRATVLDVGDYVFTKPLPTPTRCKAYTEPPTLDDNGELVFQGEYITTIDPSTYLGPVEFFCQTHGYYTILVRGYWINVSKGNKVFAKKVNPWNVANWTVRGWEHNPAPPAG